MLAADTPVLTLADLEQYDPLAPVGGVERDFLCPLPGVCRDKTEGARHRSLSVNVETGLWQCHRCGAASKLRDHWEERPRSTRLRNLASAKRAFALRLDPTPLLPDPTAPWRAAWDAALPVIATPGAGYLERRGIPLALAALAGVRYTTDWAGRPAVLFPVVNAQGMLVAVNGRYLDTRAPKTRTYGKNSLGVFVAPGLEALAADPLVLVEGPCDALSLAAVGVPAVALVTTSAPQWLPAHAALRAVCLGLDNDTPGDDGSKKLARDLAALGAHCERLRPGRKDWNDDLVALGPAALAATLAALGLAPFPSGLRTEDERATVIDQALSSTASVISTDDTTHGRHIAAEPPRCWWDAEPWNGCIAEDVFLAIVGAYRERFGFYAPWLPEKRPEILRAFGAEVPERPPTPRLPCQGCGGELLPDRWLRCDTCGPLVQIELAT
jgi:Toprim-like